MGLVEHKSEVIVINFGNIGFKDSTIPVLVEALKTQFEKESGPRMNTAYKVNGTWPTLGEAVKDNARLFVFIRGDVDAHQSFVEDIKVKPETLRTSDPRKPGAVKILSSFKSGSVGKTCSFALKRANLTCSLTQADFTKVSLFSSFGKAGVDCLWHMAKVCNPLVESTIQTCRTAFANNTGANLELRFSPNFILLDYPNYQGEEKASLPDLCKRENLYRSSLILKATSQKEISEESTSSSTTTTTSTTTTIPFFDPEQ